MMKQLSTLLTILSLAAISFAFTTTTSTATSQRNTADAVTASAEPSLQVQTVTNERYEVSSSSGGEMPMRMLARTTVMFA